jgi:hypothetical protein
MKDRNRTKELAIIESVDAGPEDHGIETIWIHMKGVEGSWGQGFGGISFGWRVDRGGDLFDKKLRDHFVAMLCQAFNVLDLERLKGLRAYVLRSWGEYNEPIEGLQSYTTGGRFTLTRWRDQAFNAGLIQVRPETPLQQRKESLRSTIQRCRRQIADAEYALEHVDDDYMEW